MLSMSLEETKLRNMNLKNAFDRDLICHSIQIENLYKLIDELKGKAVYTVSKSDDVLSSTIKVKRVKKK